MCFDFLYKFCLGRMYRRVQVKRPLFFSDFNETWIFSTYFRKTRKYQILSKSAHWEQSCSVCMDRRMDRQDAFRNSANTSTKLQIFNNLLCCSNILLCNINCRCANTKWWTDIDWLLGTNHIGSGVSVISFLGGISINCAAKSLFYYWYKMCWNFSKNTGQFPSGYVFHR